MGKNQENIVEKNNYVSEKIIECLNKKDDGLNYGKLISLINELNTNYSLENPYSTSILIRSILDHIPPILGLNNFSEVVSNYSWDKTDTKYMQRLSEFRNRADDSLHRKISPKADPFEIGGLPGSECLSALLNECCAVKHNSTLPQVESKSKVTKERKIKININSEKIEWAGNYSEYNGPAFLLGLEIDSADSKEGDYIMAIKLEEKTGNRWKGEIFKFEGEAIGALHKIEPDNISSTRVYISNDPTGTASKTMPDIDRDTLELIIQLRHGEEYIIPIKPAMISSGSSVPSRQSAPPYKPLDFTVS